MKTISQIKPSGNGKPASMVPCRLLLDVSAIRSRHKLSMQDAARAAGVSYAAWRKVELGGTPSLDSALRIAKFLELSVEALWAVDGSF